MDASLSAVVRATPADRDRFADALRAGSLLVVILGHWLMIVVTPQGEITNALVLVPRLQPLTWLLQVMPLFFLVGGVAHAYTLDSLASRGGTQRGRYAAFVTARAARLLRPTVAFLATWVVFGAIAHLTGWTRGTDGALVSGALVAVPQLLWFIGMYLGIAGFAPSMYRLHHRYGLGVVATLVIAAALVDLARFAGGRGLIGNLNFAFVWLALHQLGYCWRDGRLGRREGLALLTIGVVGATAAISWGPYPVSMVGLPGEDVSNMAPPTVALLAQGLALAGLAVLVRPHAERLLQRPAAWRAVVLPGGFAMTAFLWHLTALMIIVLLTRVAGMQQPQVNTPTWWLTRPAWFAVLAIPTAALVAAYLRYDRGRGPSTSPLAESRPWVDPLAATAVGVCFFGILMVSIAGVDILGNQPQFFLVGLVPPWAAFSVFALSCLMLWAARPRRTAD